MAHDVLLTSHPNLAHLRITGNLTHDDMSCDDELGLNEGRSMWILLDVTTMNVHLPENFLNGARNSFFVNRNTQHLAIAIKSGLLKSVALMVAKVTGRRDKLSLFETVEAAEAHLMALMKKQGVSSTGNQLAASKGQ